MLTFLLMYTYYHLKSIKIKIYNIKLKKIIKFSRMIFVENIFL